MDRPVIPLACRTFFVPCHNLKEFLSIITFWSIFQPVKRRVISTRLVEAIKETGKKRATYLFWLRLRAEINVIFLCVIFEGASNIKLRASCCSEFFNCWVKRGLPFLTNCCLHLTILILQISPHHQKVCPDIGILFWSGNFLTRLHQKGFSIQFKIGGLTKTSLRQHKIRAMHIQDFLTIQ